MPRRDARLPVGLVLVALLGATVPAPARAQDGEAAGMITELKPGRGRIEVRARGSDEWRRAGVLMRLGPADTVRATEDASAVILLSGVRGSVHVTRSSSPYVVPGPARAESKAQKALTLLEASVEFLLGAAKETPRAALATRGAQRPAVVLGPRNVLVLPDTLTFEWAGSRLGRYTVRVVGPGGPLLEQTVTGTSLDYPAGARPLVPGVRYVLEIVSGKQPVQHAWFELLDAARAQKIRQDLVELEHAVGATASPNTLVILKAAYLASRGLLHDARQAVIAALQKDPDEPTLHALLAKIYEASGLPEQADEAREEARFLTTGR